MAAVTVAGRSASIFARTILRSTPSRTRLSQVSVSNGSVPSNFNLRLQSRIFPTPSPCRLLRRELSTLVPIHSAISAACLVSKLPSEASASIQDIWLTAYEKLHPAAEDNQPQQSTDCVSS